MRTNKEKLSNLFNLFISFIMAIGFVFLALTGFGLLFKTIPALSIQNFYENTLLLWLNFIGVHPAVFWLIGFPCTFFIAVWLYNLLYEIKNRKE